VTDAVVAERIQVGEMSLCTQRSNWDIRRDS